MKPRPYHAELDQRLRNAELFTILEDYGHARGIVDPLPPRTHIFNTNPAPQVSIKEKTK